VEKYSRAGQAIDDNVTHTHCMLASKGSKYALRIRNSYYVTRALPVVFTPHSMPLPTLIIPVK